MKDLLDAFAGAIFGNAPLNTLRDKALEIATAHGFKNASIPEDIALMHSELSEALEDFRDGAMPTAIWYEQKVEPSNNTFRTNQSYHEHNSVKILNKPCGIPSEMADVVIRVLHFCGKHGIDIQQAVLEKMQFNEARPYKNGGKKI